MANTYSQLYFHVVFTVKYRQNLIHKEWKDESYKYIIGIISKIKRNIIKKKSFKEEYIEFLKTNEVDYEE
ncbi:transposase [Flavobacterium sp. CS20]|nr:transposase [Flavobacterium sp. CS20]QTY28331.1 transposase [Flavobacterium sp. CS20]